MTSLIVGDQASSASSSDDSGVQIKVKTHNRSKSAGGTLDEFGFPITISGSFNQNYINMRSNTFPKSTPPCLKKASLMPHKKKTLKKSNTLGFPVRHLVSSGLILR